MSRAQRHRATDPGPPGRRLREKSRQATSRCPAPRPALVSSGVVSDPVVLRIVRPYATVEEYLAREGWSLSVKSMVLFDAGDLAPGTLVRFDVALASGEKVIRAEGQVVRTLAPTGQRPGGLQVKFRRFGASTKELLERAMARRASVRPGAPTAPPPAESVAPPGSATSLERPSDALQPPPSLPEPSGPPPEVVPSAAPPAPTRDAADSGTTPAGGAPGGASASEEPLGPDLARTLTSEPGGPPSTAPPRGPEQSGVRHRVVGPVAAPRNRDELLARLRERARR